MSNEQQRSLRDRKVSIVLVIFLTLILGIFPFSASDYLLTMVIITLHSVYLAQSWNFIFGYCGQLALGHGIFYGIAGYFSTKLFLDANMSPYAGGFIGAFTGATLLELIKTSDFDRAVKVGLGALCGAVSGKLTKIFVAVLMAVAVIVKLF